jgi:hypothetical protein
MAVSFFFVQVQLAGLLKMGSQVAFAATHHSGLVLPVPTSKGNSLYFKLIRLLFVNIAGLKNKPSCI